MSQFEKERIRKKAEEEKEKNEELLSKLRIKKSNSDLESHTSHEVINSNEIEDLTKQNQTLKEQNHKLKLEIIDFESSKQKLQREVDELEISNKKLKDEVKKKTEELDQNRRDHKSSEEKFQRQEERLKEKAQRDA